LPWNASTVVGSKRAAPKPPPKIRERIKMLGPTLILHDAACLLADIRLLLSRWPGLVDYPERLAALLGADEHDVRAVLEALKVEGEVLS
jgi:hypothetical protein